MEQTAHTSSDYCLSRHIQTNNMRIFKEESCLVLLLSHQVWEHPVLCPLVLSLASAKSLLHHKTQNKNLSFSRIEYACLFIELLNLLKILLFFLFQAICRQSLTGLQEPCLNYASLWSSLGLPPSLWSKFPWAKIVGFGKSAVTHGLQLFNDRLGNKLAFIQLKGFISKAV